VNVAALIRAFTTYGPILDMEVFDHGYRASILFTNHADALAFVEEMTFSTHGPLFIPGIPFGQRLGAWIRNRRQRVSNNIVSMFFNFIIIFLLRELMQELKEVVVLGIVAMVVVGIVAWLNDFLFPRSLFIPSLPYGSRLGAYIRQSRHRAVSCFFFCKFLRAWIRKRRERVNNNIVSMFFNFIIIIFLLKELMQELKEVVVLGITAMVVAVIVVWLLAGLVAVIVVTVAGENVAEAVGWVKLLRRKERIVNALGVHWAMPMAT
jgi:hypothetical protein